MIKILIWMIVLAFFHALQECQIEGEAGWCKNLPTFRINVFFRKLLGGKPLTGYHIFLMIMFQIIFHIPFIFISWTWKSELITQGLFMWYWIFEDILWFIVNPKYTLKRFLKKDVEWHLRWWLGIPLSYWIGGIIGIILLILGGV
jgi:hypothetical protein